MNLYIDGLSWAAVNVCNLKFQAGCTSAYYIMASVMLISSVLSFLIPDKTVQYIRKS